MSFKIVVDSCCDLTPQMEKDPCFIRVPLTIFSNGSTFVDDDTFDQADLLWSMKQSESAPSTACPSPQMYLDAYQCGAEDIYVVTLSALLSGSHNCAQQARSMLEEDAPEINVHVFNSCSAASGEVLIALKIRELAQSGMPFKHVVREIEQFIYQMQTLFVLENLENLRKNGRLTKMQAIVTGALKIKLLCHATPEGEIAKLGQALSVKQALPRPNCHSCATRTAPAPVQTASPDEASFEDKLKQFLCASDSKMSELNRNRDGRRGNRRRK